MAAAKTAGASVPLFRSTNQIRVTSADEVEWIGHLEGAAAMPAIDIAHLIPDIGDDGIALRLGLHLYPLRRLVFLHRPVIPVGSRPKLGPAAKSRVIEIENGCVPQLVRPARNENHRDAVELRRLEQLPRRPDGLGARLEDPSIEPART